MKKKIKKINNQLLTCLNKNGWLDVERYINNIGNPDISHYNYIVRNIPILDETNIFMIIRDPLNTIFTELQFVIEKKIGNGSYGKIFDIQEKEGHKYIIKLSHESFNKGNEDKIRDFIIENLMHSVFSCYDMYDFVPRFIAPFYHINENQEDIQLGVIMEKIDHTASDFLRQSNLDISELINFYTQIARALEILGTDWQFNHRDFKPSNIMYHIVSEKVFHIIVKDIDFILKSHGKRFVLIDFGLSCMKVDESQWISESYFNFRKTCFKKGRDMAFLSLYIFLFYSHNLPDMFLKYLIYLLSNIKINGKKYHLFDIKEVKKDMWILGVDFRFKNIWDFMEYVTDHNELEKTYPMNILHNMKTYIRTGQLPHV